VKVPQCPECRSQTVKVIGMARIDGSAMNYESRFIPLRCKDCRHEFEMPASTLSMDADYYDYEIPPV
jgi:transcription elongation factor Elf1